MSNIYIQEPPTSGKVLLHTTVGDIDVELWCKETPKACRNFIQLCMEKYYDGTIFHRVIKGFIAQGGDPEGDGTGGDSIYGQPFKDEFHSRLRFVRRGLVAMANSGKDDNGSQFFFTLGATPELQNKNTIFGKVTGNTLYNMLKLEEGLVDQDDRPLYPQRIISCEVLLNPFTDIQPRVIERTVEVEPEKPKEKGKKNFSLLSFGEEAEEDEEEMNAVNEMYRGQSKSSHDLANDPKLSSVPAVAQDDHFSESAADGVTLDAIKGKLEKAGSDKRNVAKKETAPTEEEDGATRDDSEQKREEVRKQIKDLKKELRKKKQKEAEVVEEVQEKGLYASPFLLSLIKNTVSYSVFVLQPLVEENSVLAQYHKTHNEYRNKLKTLPQKGTSNREKLTLQLLEKFKQKLETAKEHFEEDEEAKSDDEKEDDGAWLAHCFRAEEQKVVLAKDANLPTSERYDLDDPRNPMVQRRRHEKKPKTQHRE
ncbi:spliceosome-associated protein CWC27 homolog [Uloborus diversus]|uniref:spliceosome-associated protein CWC27 homolog n=1 Tax=Uloborus diversus TaxID=327109 RepID=UPI00240A2BA0|nr:spliceosome-associated protein CWC27 homolog [Uloborus diversus]